jgi:hypothetical protein
MIKELILTKGPIALIDDIDFLFILNMIPWTHEENGRMIYACKYKLINGKQKRIYMHDLIAQRMGLILNKNEQIDHKNRIGIHNFRDNIRKATHQQNAFNREKRNDSKNKYKGVRPNTQGYQAFIGYNYEEIPLGTFPSEEMAARVYDYHAIRLFKEFAVLNFPESRGLYRF